MSRKGIWKKLLYDWGKWYECVLGIKNGCIIHIRDYWAPFNLWFHYCTCRLNFVIEIFSLYPLMNMIKGLLVSLFTYFGRRPKQCVELAKFASIMETNGQKDILECENKMDHNIGSL